MEYLECARKVLAKQIEQATGEIEMKLNNSMEKVIETNKIGELVIQKLRKIDEIAYVRFASVYRQFKDKNEFKEELNKLLK